MTGLAQLYSGITGDIQAALRIFREELASDSSFLSDLCRHVEQFHGKHIRPALLLLSGQACGKLRTEHHVLAAVVEMVHISTLVHDDVLDEADIRRRAATVNRLWGNERAVLLGDYLISHAFHLCSSLDETFPSRVIGRACNAMCEGEMMQVANRDNMDLSEAEYLDIITRKTAALLGACSLLGARYAGAPERTVRRLHEFGVALGVAFQIADDVLDLTGDEAEAGKSLGRDVHKGKLTLPLIHYLRTEARRGDTMDGTDGRAAALALLRGVDPQRYRQIARLLADSNSLDYARDVAARYVCQAVAVLSELPPSEARDALAAMAEFVIARRQ
jgi:octaprenyl-diphosphate synthase